MNPILLDFPEKFESQRLLIRAPRAGDGAAVNALVMESIDDLRPWMPWVTPPPTAERSEESVRKAIGRWKLREDMWMLLFSKETGQLVGGSGLHRIDWTVPRFEIGYWVGRPFVRQGLITEAVQRITRLAFEDLHARRVEIRCDDLNIRSTRVAERCGFPLEGISQNDSRSPAGELRSTRVYARTQ